MEISVTELSPRKTECCVVIGVWNEGERFRSQLERMCSISGMPDIIIADGGSDDGSTSIENLKGRARAIVIDKRKHGLSGQYQSALQFALTQGYAGAVMVDGNGKDGIEAVPAFLEALQEGFDFVQGSRFLKGGSFSNTPILRLIGIRSVLVPTMYLGSGFLYTDPINGFKAVSRNMLEHSGLQPFRSDFKGYSLQYYFNYRAPKLGLRVRELPVKRDYPSGRTPTKIHGILAHLKILAWWGRTCIGGYSPTRHEETEASV